MSDAIKVTVTDPATGEVLGERTIDNDYMVICAGTTFVHGTQIHANGTHVLTIKRALPAADPAPVDADEAATVQVQPRPIGDRPQA